MATAAGKAAGGGAVSQQQQQQQAQAEALFEAKHAELVAEARGVARDFGADVRAMAFRPGGGGGGGAVAHEFHGVPRGARVMAMIRRTVAKDVSAMGTIEEVAEHERQLLALRAIVARELHSRTQNKARAAAVAGGKRAPEQQETTGACAGGDNKIRRIIID